MRVFAAKLIRTQYGFAPDLEGSKEITREYRIPHEMDSVRPGQIFGVWIMGDAADEKVVEFITQGRFPTHLMIVNEDGVMMLLDPEYRYDFA